MWIIFCILMIDEYLLRSMKASFSALLLHGQLALVQLCLEFLIPALKKLLPF